MKIFRSIGLILAIAIGSALGVCSLIAYPILRTLADTFDRAACGVKRLDLELAQKFGDVVKINDDVLANMKRESHGFRQTGASDLYMRAEYAL